MGKVIASDEAIAPEKIVVNGDIAVPEKTITYENVVTSKKTLVPGNKEALRAIKDPQTKTILKKTIGKAANVETVLNLRLDNAQISNIEGFLIFKKLNHLSLSGNFLNNIAPLSQLKHLKTLDLSKNQIIAPSGINSLERLESLDISNNQLKYAFCCSFVSLRYLKLNNNNIQQLLFINNFNKLLEEVDISNNPLKNIAIKAPLPALKKLNASGTFITQLNDFLNLPSLETLEIKNCIHLKSITILFQRIGDHWKCNLNRLKKLMISKEFLDNDSKAILADIENQKDSKLIIQ